MYDTSWHDGDGELSKQLARGTQGVGPAGVVGDQQRLGARRRVVAELADTDDTTRRIYESYSSFQRGVENYHAISEEAYIDARRNRD